LSQKGHFKGRQWQRKLNWKKARFSGRGRSNGDKGKRKGVGLLERGQSSRRNANGWQNTKPKKRVWTREKSGTLNHREGLHPSAPGKKKQATAETVTGSPKTKEASGKSERDPRGGQAKIRRKRGK